jgi:hypothetical protein
VLLPLALVPSMAMTIFSLNRFIVNRESEPL